MRQLGAVANQARSMRLDDLTIDQGTCQFEIPLLVTLTKRIVKKSVILSDLTVHGINLITQETASDMCSLYNLTDLQINRKAIKVCPMRFFEQLKLKNLHLECFDFVKISGLARLLMDKCSHLTVYRPVSFPIFPGIGRRPCNMKSITLHCRKVASTREMMTTFLKSLPACLTSLKIRHPDRRITETDDIWTAIGLQTRQTLQHAEWRCSLNDHITYPNRSLFTNLNIYRMKGKRRDSMDSIL